jgi:hypothetical protein
MNKLDTEIVRFNIIDVYRLMQVDGLSKRKACEQLGFAWSTFMRWQLEHPEVLKELEVGRKEILQSNLVQLDTAYQEVVNKLVDQAGTATQLMDLLALETRLGMMRSEALRSSGDESEQQKSAAKFLTGIKPVQGVSKITRTTETVEFQQDDDVITIVPETSVVQE